MHPLDVVKTRLVRLSVNSTLLVLSFFVAAGSKSREGLMTQTGINHTWTV